MARYREKQDLWEARVRIEGKQKSFYGVTESEAETKARMAAQAFLPSINLGQSPLVSEFVATQVAPLYLRCSPATQRVAKWGLNVVIDGIGQIPCRDLTLGHVTSFLSAIDSRMKKGAVAAIRAYTFRICRLMVREGWIRYNYVEEWRGKTQAAARLVPTVEEALTFIEATRHLPWGGLPLIGLMIGTGKGEAASITRDCLGDDRVLVPGTKNDYRRRVVYPGPSIMRELHRMAKESPGKWLVCGRDGTQFTTNWDRMIKDSRQAAWSKPFDWHSFRHAFGAIEHTLGCPRSIRMAYMGQSIKSLVGDLYVHPTPESQAYWGEKWASYLGLADRESTEYPQFVPSLGLEKRGSKTLVI
jgi:hypothetical protein